MLKGLNDQLKRNLRICIQKKNQTSQFWCNTSWKSTKLHTCQLQAYEFCSYILLESQFQGKWSHCWLPSRSHNSEGHLGNPPKPTVNDLNGNAQWLLYYKKHRLSTQMQYDLWTAWRKMARICQFMCEIGGLSNYRSLKSPNPPSPLYTRYA